MKKDYYYCEEIKRENKTLKEIRETLDQKVREQEYIIVQKDSINLSHLEMELLKDQQIQLFKDRSRKKSKKLTYSIVGNITLAILLFFTLK